MIIRVMYHDFIELLIVPSMNRMKVIEGSITKWKLHNKFTKRIQDINTKTQTWSYNFHQFM